MEDESFRYDNKVIKRVKGASAGNIMKSWRDIRKEPGALFEDIQVYAQPAAVIDGIVQVWILKDLGKEFPASIWQRDIVGAAMTVEAKEAMSLIGQIPAFIAGKMTPVLQVTDTDFAFRLKVFIRQEMDVLRDALRQKAKLQELPCVFKCGPFEVLWCRSS